MKVRRFMPWVACALAASFAVAGASYGGSSAVANVRLGVVTDIGGLNDRGFNALANKGRLRADKVKGISSRVLISRSNADYIPNLSGLARDQYTLVIGVGFLMTKEVETVANRFPNVKFAGIDISYSDLDSKPKNYLGLMFKEQDAGCLVGYLAALTIKGSGQQIISSVGGQRVPAVDRFIAGYEFCAKRANSRIRVSHEYSQSFTDQAKCKEIALNQISAGSRVVFAVAGGCGLGALDAAKQRGKWGIGVDADQGYLGKHMLTSALKRVDNAVYKAALQVKSGKYRGGRDIVFGAASGGVGLGKVSSRVPKKFVTATLKIQKQLASGKLKPPNRL